jgi:hypothetical protein
MLGLGLGLWIEKAEDIDYQGPDVAKAARAEELGGDSAREAFQQIKLGGRGVDEVDARTGMPLL